MEQLPSSRIELIYPFLHCGVDYAELVLIADRKGRGCRLLESYICIFVCFASKAVHLELVTELTKETYMAALNRFIAFKGKPKSIYSDNATNFVGRYTELYTLLKDSEYVSDTFQEGIGFVFAPAHSHHFDGLSKAAGRSTKHHLRRILNLTHFTFEEMTICLYQIEAVLNSRPVTQLSHSIFMILPPLHQPIS
ncbi:hypothetical protein EVAR_59363_1 [Eumeta japonica]|uniref:Integrase catalytic domain-containing protein n=1 Tax=Eumeta variegata TaxID=151549 RepID=A0A4C1SMG5_EUMVA|nr:hypothetical protein EVAR_59363_1 [Eumeta japonica]